MVKFICQKLRYNAKTYIWLLLGMTVFIAVITMLPMIYHGSLNHIIQQSVSESGSTYQPGVVKIPIKADAARAEEIAVNNLAAYKEKFGIPTLGSQTVWGLFYNLKSYDNLKVINEYKGERDKDAFPASVSKREMLDSGHTLGEIIEIYDSKKTQNFKFQIVSVVEEDNVEDYNWFESISSGKNNLIISKDDMMKIAEKAGEEINVDLFIAFDYRYINDRNADVILAAIDDVITNNSEALSLPSGGIFYSSEVYDESEIEDIFIEAGDQGYLQAFGKYLGSQSLNDLSGSLKEYKESKISVAAMLAVTAFPILVYIFMFLNMLMKRIAENERRDIGVLRSRGKKRSRIISMYLMQGLILSAVASVPGLGLAYLLGKIGSYISGFMSFDSIKTGGYVFDRDMLIVLLIALLVLNAVMIFPFFKISKNTIIDMKKEKFKYKEKPVWERCFLDVIMLAGSIYLCYKDLNRLDDISQSVADGEIMDPLIFINSIVFIIAVALFCSRLVFMLMRLIYKLRSRKMSLVTYSAFTEIIRGRRTNTFIVIFLILSISISIFHSSVARSVSESGRTRIIYDSGADISIEEYWKIRNSDMRMVYVEPDYEALSERYPGLQIDKKTRVINMHQKINGSAESRIMAINTKEFGETAHMPDNVLDKHWYNYLNDLASDMNNVLISENLAEELEVKEGDKINIDFIADLEKIQPSYDPSKVEDVVNRRTMTVAGIVKAWPTYNMYSYSTDSSDRYLVVMNYAALDEKCAKTPYTIMCKGKKIKGLSGIQNGYDYMSVEADNIAKFENSSSFKITNIVLSLELIISLFLCAVGFMIYWITNIKSKETTLGIYRAMGISKNESRGMVVMEELILTCSSVLIGLFTGFLSVKLFMPLYTALYLPEKHPIRPNISILSGDSLGIALFVVLIFVICNVILWKVIANLKITDAVKLGED